MKKIVEERLERPVDMGVLAAFVAEGSLERGATVQAIGLMRVPVGGFARLRFDRAPNDAAGDRIANRLEFAPRIPLGATLGALHCSC